MVDDSLPAAPAAASPVLIHVDAPTTADWSPLCARILAHLLAPTPPPLTLSFDCCGGYTNSGVGLGQLLAAHPATVTGLVVGVCRSSAVFLFAGCHRRFVLPASEIMLHPASLEREKNTHATAAAWSRVLRDETRIIADWLAVRFGTGREVDWFGMLTDGEHYWTGQEFIDNGWAEAWPSA